MNNYFVILEYKNCHNENELKQIQGCKKQFTKCPHLLWPVNRNEIGRLLFKVS